MPEHSKLEKMVSRRCVSGYYERYEHISNGIIKDYDHTETESVSCAYEQRVQWR